MYLRVEAELEGEQARVRRERLAERVRLALAEVVVAQVERLPRGAAKRPQRQSAGGSGAPQRQLPRANRSTSRGGPTRLQRRVGDEALCEGARPLTQAVAAQPQPREGRVAWQRLAERGRARRLEAILAEVELRDEGSQIVSWRPSNGSLRGGHTTHAPRAAFDST